MKQQDNRMLHRPIGSPNLLPLVLLWLVAAVADRLWFALDKSIPGWDQADYLTGALNYWRALQTPQWLDPQWWQNLWLLSSKIPPGTYIATAAIHNIFGTGAHAATLINLCFSAILLYAVFGLGTKLFNPTVGWWAALFCLIFPGLLLIRLDFLLDYPLTATCTLAFYLLTLWRSSEPSTRTAWLLAIGFGFTLGAALMVKQTAILFLLIPCLWAIITTIRRRQVGANPPWLPLVQLGISFLIALVITYPWYRTNWLLILTGSKRATVDAAIAEGDPALNTLAAWTHYLQLLPEQISWPLLLIPLLAALLYGRRRPQAELESLQWLAGFWLGAYLLCSLNLNKDFRYVLPYLPIMAVFLAQCFTLWPGSWGRSLRFGTVAAATLMLIPSVWPTDSLAELAGTHRAYTGPSWPHAKVVQAVVEADPYLQANIGVLPSTLEVNQHNINYYGAQADFQVYGRQVGTRSKDVAKDARSMSWFITKTGPQGSVPSAQPEMVTAVEKSSDFRLYRSWPLPDNTTLNLYRRQFRNVRVVPLPETPSRNQVQLERVIVPPRVPPGIPVPVTYQWLGPAEELQQGLVLLDWVPVGDSSSSGWWSDRAIGRGILHLQNQLSQAQVIETTAILPPAATPPGKYTLTATYLHRHSKTTYPLKIPPVTLEIDPNALPAVAPEPELITQLQTLATALPNGPNALGPVFDEVGRIAQYDPTQDYLRQAELTLAHRLQQQPNNLSIAYNLSLARVLRRDASGAAAALQRVTELDPKNPYAHAYLAFVNLYDWRPFAAAAPLKTALELAPQSQEIQILAAVGALMRGNPFQTWHYLQDFIPSGVKLVVKFILGASLLLVIVLMTIIITKFMKNSSSIKI
ncbi:glycosyltransferase family 39 protein [[Phormidium] sp. ETS-05]|uniref:glycosyltransferase family 39 protein n=1 Tax=[Phormidium] sp. ETS-05 TaxID=222819 RepID=UPI0031FF44FE